MYYLFDKDGNTSTLCPDDKRLFDMFAVENDAGEKALPDGYSIKEYDGYVDPGMLYLDDEGEVKMRVFEVDEAEEAARKKAAALTELDARYKADKEELSSQYLDAAMSGDNDTMDAIKQELAALNAKYDADYKALSAE
jgi:hypothetical protein